MNAHERKSSDDSPGGCASAVLAADLRLACQHRLIALQTVHLQQAQIGRNDVADPQVHNVTRNDLGNGDLGRLPVAIDKRQVPDLGVQRLDRLLRAVLVEEAQADTHRHDADDDQRLRPVTNDSRDDSREEQQQQQITPQLADEHRKSADAVREQHVRPINGQTPARLDARQAPIRRAKLAQHVSNRQPRSYSQIKLLRLGHLRRQGATAQTKHADTIARGSAATWANDWSNAGAPRRPMSV